jgi:transcriptional regulator with XRE-family HTH domain
MKKTVKEGRIFAVFGANLKKIRKTANLSQLDLALKAGITHNFINDIEHCYRGVSLQTIQRLAESLNISPHVLFIDDERELEKALSPYPEHIESLLKAVEEFRNHYEQ